jgi:histidinol-phosphate aminotransferase
MAGRQSAIFSPRLTRRNFARLLGAGAGAALLAPQVAARGWEERLALRATGRLQPAKLMPKDPTNLILLNSNENAYGPSPAALEAMVEAHSVAMRYPDYWADQLQEKLAEFHEVDPEMVVVTCGSQEMLKLAAQAFLGPDKRLVVAEPTFEALVYYGRQTGAEIVKVPVAADYRHDLEAMAKAAQERPGLVYLCNPNNPTGRAEPHAAVEAFLARVPGEGVVLADEAYLHYVDAPDYQSLLGAVKAGKNVVVTRTFSKIYGMAGLRLGYGLARQDLMERMRPHQVIESWNVMACAAALASLDDEDWVSLNQERNRSSRAFLVKAMEERGREVIPSDSNFVCVSVPVRVPAVIKEFREEGLSIGREFAGLPEHIRVSIGTPEEMEKFVEVYDKLFRVGHRRSSEQAGRRPRHRRRLPGEPPLWARA